MKISIDRRAKMIPIMEISAGDEVNIGGFDYVVENIIPCRKGSYSDAYYYKVRLVRRHNRQIHKQKIPKGGIKRLNQSPFEVFGLRLFDRVMFENSYYFIFGRRKTGSFNIRDIDGKNQKNVTYKKLKLSRCKRFMIQKEMN